MIKIIQAQLDHLPSLQHIGQMTYKQHFSKIWTETGIQKFLDDDFSVDQLKISLQREDQLWFLLFDHNIIQGFAKINLNQYHHHLKQVGTEIQKIYFLKTATNKNYGHHLLKFILHYLDKKQSEFIYLEVLSNNIKAQKFYKKYGFQETLEIPYSTDLYSIGMRIMTLNNIY